MNTITFDDLETPINAAPTTVGRTVYTETCKKCGGKGLVMIGYVHLRSVRCYSCDGTGKHEFKTSPQHRAKAQASAAKRKEAAAEKLAAQILQWCEDHAVEFQWMKDSAPTFGFAQSMMESLYKFGTLTEKQFATVQRLTAESAERKARWAAEKAAATQSAPSVTVDKIEQAFAAAKSHGIRYPKLRLDSFVFSTASESSKNVGALYVKQGDEYLGKIFEGRFLKVRSCDSDTEARVVAAASNPENAAVAYGQRFGSCSCCGRELTNKESIDRGIGPICASHFGW